MPMVVPLPMPTMMTTMTTTTIVMTLIEYSNDNDHDRRPTTERAVSSGPPKCPDAIKSYFYIYSCSVGEYADFLEEQTGVILNLDFGPVAHVAPNSFDDYAAQRVQCKFPRRYLFPAAKASACRISSSSSSGYSHLSSARSG